MTIANFLLATHPLHAPANAMIGRQNGGHPDRGGRDARPDDMRRLMPQATLRSSEAAGWSPCRKATARCA